MISISFENWQKQITKYEESFYAYLHRLDIKLFIEMFTARGFMVRTNKNGWNWPKWKYPKMENAQNRGKKAIHFIAINELLPTANFTNILNISVINTWNKIAYMNNGFIHLFVLCTQFYS